MQLLLLPTYIAPTPLIKQHMHTSIQIAALSCASQSRCQLLMPANWLMVSLRHPGHTTQRVLHVMHTNSTQPYCPSAASYAYNRHPRKHRPQVQPLECLSTVCRSAHLVAWISAVSPRVYIARHEARAAGSVTRCCRQPLLRPEMPGSQPGQRQVPPAGPAQRPCWHAAHASLHACAAAAHVLTPAAPLQCTYQAQEHAHKLAAGPPRLHPSRRAHLLLPGSMCHWCHFGCCCCCQIV
ncbi:hypothetical protein COO60DRAFT_1549097 [Scenedesmus sp. NREL 46B-D3]|nr:hypothetical protein COO60DRAFT_1549097 [Scenedesmus sp. NREL 46B-D3]